MDDSENSVERDEIIADSEDELAELGSSNAAGRGSALSMPPPRQRPELSSIADFSSAKVGQDSSISGFTGGPTNAIGTTPDCNERSFGRDADTSGYSNVFDDTFTGTLSIADRAKTRKRKSTDVLELTSDEDDELVLKPTSAKSKAKGKSPQSSSNIQANQPSSNTSNPQHSSDSSSSKPRPRPRPVAKKSRMENAAYLEATKDWSVPPMPLRGPELSITTSPSRGHLHSDLPPSSMSTGIPRIETMGDVDDLFDGPLSSPGSLFSEDEGSSKHSKKKKQKRKSYRSDVEMEVDQLASPPPHIPSFNLYDEPVTGPPPPTFFAGSSQPEEPASRSFAEQASKASTSSHVIPTSDPDVIDLTDIPATLAPAITVKAKPKKPRKKTSEEDFGAWEENGAAGLYVFDDDNDEDFNPSGDGVGKKKAKSKGKGKEKEKSAKVTKVKGKGKQRNLDTTSDDIPVQIPENPNPEQHKDLPPAQPPTGIPEVVITTKPARKSRKTKDKKKGTSVATGTSSSNKEVFKSREFIDDSGDDVSGPGPLTTNIEAQAPSEADAFEIPEEATIPVDMAASGGRGSRGKKQRSNVMASEDEDEFVLKPSATKKGKKKAVVDADESADEWERLDNGGINQSDEVIRPSEPTNKGKEAKKKGKASKKKVDDAAKDDTEVNEEAVISNIRKSLALEQTPEELPAEEEPEEIVATKPSKKASRKVAIDDDDDTRDQDEQVDQQLSGINSSSKENRAPNYAPSLATPNVRANSGASSSKPVPGALYARYEITPRTRGPSMSELIRRANSHPSSPFAHATPSEANKSSASGKLKSRPSLTPASRVYSPYLKSSRSMLNKIAPLHPNRRTPPPPPPPIPPKKKTKKELEREERWEEELVESIGGLEAWAALGDDERKDMRRAKFAMEMGGWDD